jgi:hypothetical protein
MLGAITLTVALACCYGAQAQRIATAVAIVANGSVARISVTDGGSGYFIIPTVTLVGGGTDATAIAEVASGAVSRIII